MFQAAFSLSQIAAPAEGWGAWLDRLLNPYPGVELWKFLNLFIFVAVGVYILRRPLRAALRSRGEGIKRELERAREERDKALAELAEVEKRLQGLDAEVETIRVKSKAEAEAERERIRLITETELTKVREQAHREIESAAKAARQELREFAAEQSINLAKNLIRKEIRPEDDERLISINLKELGRASN